MNFSSLQVFLLGLIAGICVILFLAERDEEVQKFSYEHLVYIFNNVYKSRLIAEKSILSLMEQAITLHNVSVYPLEGSDWWWKAKTMRLKSSLLETIKNRAFPIDVELDEVTCQSLHKNGSWGIVNHLKHLAAGDTGYPVKLRSLMVQEANFSSQDPYDIQVLANLSAAGFFGEHDIVLDLSLQDAMVKHVDRLLSHSMMGTMKTTFHKRVPLSVTSEFFLQGIQPQLHETTPFLIQGSWKNDQGFLRATLQDLHMSATAVYADTKLHIELENALPLAMINRMIQPSSQALVGGTMHHTSRLELADTVSVHGEFFFNDVQYKQQLLGSSVFTYHHDNQQWFGDLRLKHLDAALPHLISWKYDDSEQFLTLQAECAEDKKYTMHCKLTDYYKPQQISFWHNKQQVIEVNRTPIETMEGTLSYELLQPLIEQYAGISVPGSGLLHMSCCLKNGLLCIEGGLRNGIIHIPSFFNFFTAGNFSLSLDIMNQLLMINNAQLIFEKGKILCRRGIIQGISCKPSYMYIPVIIRNLFLNIGKQIFAVASGHVELLHKNQEARLQGILSIDRSYVKRNLFSSDVQSTFIRSLVPRPHEGAIDSDLSLQIITKNPIQVKTSFLTSSVAANMMIAGTVYQPSISGELTVKQGQLLFPYKPLTITQGHIYFMPHQLDDPLFELVAKGKARTYQIGMRCQGSLKNPQVSFESSPPLSQEQIITLLIAGSVQGALSLVMPALIMQHLQAILFGPEQSQSRLERYFKNLLAPLRHIRFVPSFADQKARGGVRGAFEIEVNDQLRALIQKNFSLTEDTRLEVEYAVTDDISVRGIRDERGDLGGEIEMRWKF